MIARVMVTILGLGLLAALGWAALSLPDPGPSLAGPALERLSESGVKNPVTAVLLNYRGYDTLLEVAVLLLALVGVWLLQRGTWPAPAGAPHPMLEALLRWLVPVLILVAAYLLWIGAFAPGGAFQGGAVLGGALVLLTLAGRGRGLLQRGWLLRLGLTIGGLVFVAMAALTLAWTGGLLRYPPGHAGTLILVIEAAALLSIGLTLGAMYLGGRPPYRSDDELSCTEWPDPPEADRD